MNTLQIELLKTKRAGTYILLGIAIVFAMLFASLEIYSLKSSVGDSNIKQILSLQQSLLNLLMAIFLCINIGKEYSENTLRRGIIEGYTRHQFFNGKLILVFVSVLLVSVLYWLQLGIAGLVSGKWEAIKAYFTIPELVNSFVGFLSTGVFAFFLVFITRSVAIGIVLYFVWPIAEALTKVAEQLMSQLKNQEIHIYRYLPLGSMYMVLHSPDPVTIPQVSVAVFYVLLMLLIPYLLFLKRDIK